MIAADRSGAGKTTVTCGLLFALRARGLKLQSFKCGPDYIDPMFHRQVLGVPSGNLDSFFTDAETLRQLFSEECRRSEAELSLIEGAMGYYDGLGGISSRGSAWEIAGILKAPTVLVLDGKGISVSMAALLQGLLQYPEGSKAGVSDASVSPAVRAAETSENKSSIRGVILNRVSPMFYPRLKSLLEQQCPGLRVLGFLPEMPELRLPSRHLGLVQPEELTDVRQWAETAAQAVERYVELDALLELADEACRRSDVPLGSRPENTAGCSCFSETPEKAGPAAASSEKTLSGAVRATVRIAVSEDEAFRFSYQENRTLLEELGAELVPFSPLRDAALPEDIGGLLLTGGYPELHTEALYANASMRHAVAEAVRQGLPTLAECGGYMYLLESIEGVPMCGVLPGNAVRMPRLVRFGYIEAVTQRDSVLGPAGTVLRGHEFHHYDAAFNGADCRLMKPAAGIGGAAVETWSYEGIYLTDSLAAGFPHFYYRSYPEAAACFVSKCRAWRGKSFHRRSSVIYEGVQG